MKLFFYALRDYDELEYCKRFSEQYGIGFDYVDDYPSTENAVLAQGSDAVSMTPCDMSAPVVEAFHRAGVKYITCRSIGYDHVDRKKAAELGIRVANVTYPPDGVANYAIMLMLMCTRRFAHIMKRAEIQDYTLKNKLGKDISSCTVGVLGTGRIGTAVIEHLSGFGCRLLAYDRYENDKVRQYGRYVSLDELFARSDILTLHANATGENYHIICKESLSKMKDGVILVNTARGKLISSADLIDAVESGKVGGAALDVLEDENGLYYYNKSGMTLVNREMAVLRSFPNVILSPHTAFYTQEDVSDMVRGCFESLYAFETGVPAIYEVQPE